MIATLTKGLPRAQNRHSTPCRLPASREAILHTLHVRTSPESGLMVRKLAVLEQLLARTLRQFLTRGRFGMGLHEAKPAAERGLRITSASCRGDRARDRTGPLRITAPVCCYRTSARASSRCADSAGANGGAASVVTALRRSRDLAGCGNVDQDARTGAAAFGTSRRTRHCTLQPAVSSSPNGRQFPAGGADGFMT